MIDDWIKTADQFDERGFDSGFVRYGEICQEPCWQIAFYISSENFSAVQKCHFKLPGD